MKSKIEKLDYEGRGISHIDGKVTFIPRSLPNEVGLITIKEEKKNYNVAHLESIVEKSSKRIPSYCPYAFYCGGCTFDITSYQDSLLFKKEILKDLFQKNNIFLPEFEVVPSRPVLGYRNKVTLHVENFKFGYYKEETHDFVPIQKCFLASDTITSILDDFSLYSFSSGTLMIRVNEKGESILAIETKNALKIKEEFVLKHNVKGILWNGKCVYGVPFLLEKRGSFLYKIPASAFFQVNPYISEKIVDDILSFVSNEDTLFDLYSGVGFFSLRLSEKAKKVIGIEANVAAVLAAMENVKLNQISNVVFHAGKVEDILRKIPEKSKKVLVDPPRSGLHKKVVECFLKDEISTIFYISCNPITLVRDLKKLCKKYCISFFRCYDMFSYTKHVECVCVLNLKNKENRG